MSFSDPELLDPAITPFSKCPYCKKLIVVEIIDGELFFEEMKCPHCEIFIEESDLINGFIKDFSLTQAFASAQKISSMDLAIIAFICVSLLSLWIELPFWFRVISTLPYLSPIFICLQWFNRHYWYDHFIDEEYNLAVRDMKKSLLLWICANIFCLLLLLF